MKTIVWTKTTVVRTLLGVAVLSTCLGCNQSLDQGLTKYTLAAKVTIKTGTITTSLTSTPAAPITNSRSITFDFTSNAIDAKFRCQLGTLEPFWCTPPVSYANLLDGSYLFRVFAVSPTMGTDLVGARHTWTVDTVPPVTQMVGSQTARDAVFVALSANKPSCSFVCSLDGATPVPCTNPAQLSGIAPGPHTFKAQAVDQATNLDPVGATYSFQVQPAIQTTITGATPSALFSNQTAIVFSFIANQSNATFLCTLGNGKATACSSPMTYQGLPDALYDFKVQAVDAFGSVDPLGAGYSWTVDTVPPVGALAPVVATSTSLTITWTTNEPATTKLFWGANNDLSRETAEDPIFRTTHVVKISGLSSNSPYSLQPAGADRATNSSRLTVVKSRTMR